MVPISREVFSQIGPNRLDRPSPFIRIIPSARRLRPYNPTVWPAVGGQLFYDHDITAQVQVVSYTVTGDSFVAAPARPWSPSLVSHYIAKMFDISDDGKQAVSIQDDDSAGSETHLRLILNFGDELRRRFAAMTK